MIRILMSAPRSITRYTLDELISMNKGDTIRDTRLLKMFAEHNALDKPFITNYRNPHNKNLYATDKQNKTVFIKQAHEYSDVKVLENIRKIISQVQKNDRGKINLATERLNGLMIPETQINAIAKLFQETMVECDFLIDEYISVLLGFNLKHNKDLVMKIYSAFIRYVTTEFDKPSKFKDSNTETAEDKEHRWRSRNCLIIAKLYVQRFNRPEHQPISRVMVERIICQKFLDTIFTQLDFNKPNSIEILVSIWNVISEKLQVKVPAQYKLYVERIRNLMKDPSCKATNKIRLNRLISTGDSDSDSDSD